MKKKSEIKTVNQLTSVELENVNGGNWLTSLWGGIIAGWNHDVEVVTSTITYEYVESTITYHS